VSLPKSQVKPHKKPFQTSQFLAETHSQPQWRTCGQIGHIECGCLRGVRAKGERQRRVIESETLFPHQPIADLERNRLNMINAGCVICDFKYCGNSTVKSAVYST
jgi:hypothetical protein